MMSLTLNCIANKSKFAKSMEDLALRHCERGVRGVEYGVVGDVLFYTMRKTIGLDAYSKEVELAWVKIYSAMLAIIVPLVIEYERTGVVNRTVERDTGSGGELMDSCTAAALAADKLSAERERAKSAERESGDK